MSALTKLVGTSAFRWLIGTSIVFLTIAALVVGYVYWLTNDLLTRQLGQTIAAEVKGLNEQFRLGGVALLAATVSNRSQQPGSSLYLLADGQGNRAAGNLDRLPPALRHGGESALFRYFRGAAGGSAERQAVGVVIDVEGGYRLVVGRDIEDQRAFAEKTRSVLLWGLGIIAFTGIAGSLAASRALLRRIDGIAATSRAIMGGELTDRIPLDGTGDEIDRLAQSLNAMLDRIVELMTGLREVSDNIAHDLKTPLTRLRARVETALRQPDGSANHRAALERTIEDADELIRTFNALLSIARLEAGTAGERMAQVDIAAVVRDAVELYEPLAEAEGLHLRFEAAPGRTIRADRELIGQAVINLIDNAIKYASRAPARPDDVEARAISIRVDRTPETVEVSVADRGPGIGAADRERVLKRFVRLEASRTQPGIGLGLSVVAAIMRLHGGSLRLEDNQPGLKVVIVLPGTSDQSAAASG